MKILFHAINGVGLGHISRTLTIAKQIKMDSPDVEILFMTSTVFTKIFDDYGFRHVNCPHLTYENYNNQEVNDAITSIIEDFNPDIVVYDTHFPRKVIEDPRNSSRINVLVLRRMKNDMLKQLIFDPIMSRFSKVLLPHSLDEFKHYNLPREIMDKLEYSPKFRFCGPVVKDLEEQKIEIVKRKYKLDDVSYIILAMSGGGGQYQGTTSTDDFFQACVDSFSQIKEQESIPGARLILIKGPLSKKQFLAEKGVIIVEFEEHLLELMKCSNLIISRAGYNSVNEILKVGTPSIILDILCTHDDQKERAGYLAAKSKSVFLEDKSQLKDAILSRYNEADESEESGEKKPFILEDGKSAVSAEILGLLQSSVQKENNKHLADSAGKKQHSLDYIYNTSLLDSGNLSENTLANLPDILIDTPSIKKKLSKDSFLRLVLFNSSYIQAFAERNMLLPSIIFSSRNNSNNYNSSQSSDSAAWFSGIDDFGNFMHYLYSFCNSGDSISYVTKLIISKYKKLEHEQVKAGFAAMGLLGIIESSKFLNPEEITLSLTNRCNLKCAMCDIWKSERKIDLPREKISFILDSFKEESVKSVSLTGGEIFLRDDMFDIYSLIRNSLPKAHINFSTNGYAVDAISSFVNLFADPDISFTISVDGINCHDLQRGVSGSFEKIKQAISLLKYKAIRTEIKFTITPVNYREILSAYEFAKKESLYFQLKPACLDKNYTNKQTSEDAEIFIFSEHIIASIEDQINLILNDNSSVRIDRKFIGMIPKYLRGETLSFKCSCPEKSLFFMEDGKVYSCLQSENIGDLNIQPVKSILKSQNAKSVISCRRNCSECLSYYGSIESVEKSGKIMQPAQQVESYNLKKRLASEDIVLVYPPNKEFFSTTVPTGVGQLAAYLVERGFGVRCVNLDAKLYLESIAKSITNIQPETSFDWKNLEDERINKYLLGNSDPGLEKELDRLISIIAINKSSQAKSIGFSILIDSQLGPGLCIAKRIKDIFPEKKIIFGGSVLSYRSAMLIEKYSWIDFIVEGDGEIPLEGILKLSSENNLPDAIPGATFIKDGKVVQSKPVKTPLSDARAPLLDGLYEDYFKIAEITLAKNPNDSAITPAQISNAEDYPIIPYLISRGCLNDCAFCDYNDRANIELKPVKKIIDEIRVIRDTIQKNSGNNNFFIYLGCTGVNLSEKHLKSICLGLIEEKLDIKWISFAYANPNFTKDLAKILKQSGCASLSFGVESGSEKLLKSYGKNLKIAEFERCLKLCKDERIITDLSFLVGTPNETKEDLKQTIEFIRRNAKNIDIAYVSVLRLNPRVPLFIKMDIENKISIDNSSFTTKFSSSSLPDKDYVLALKNIVENVMAKEGIELYRYEFSKEGFKEIDDPLAELDKVFKEPAMKEDAGVAEIAENIEEVENVEDNVKNRFKVLLINPSSSRKNKKKGKTKKSEGDSA